MQHAIVISSHYGANSGYPNLVSWSPSAELLAARLAQHGYDIDRLLPGSGAVQRLRQSLHQENLQASVVVYFAGYALITEGGDPALLMADDNVTALRLSQLVSKLGRSFGRVLLMVDGSLGSAALDVQAAALRRGVSAAYSPEATMVELSLAACGSPNVSVLMGIRPWGAQDRRVSPFARKLEQGLKELANAETATGAHDLFNWLQQAESGMGLALGYKPAEPEFVVLPIRQYPASPDAMSPLPMVRMALDTPIHPIPSPRPGSLPPQAVKAQPERHNTLFNWPPQGQAKDPEPVFVSSWKQPSVPPGGMPAALDAGSTHVGATHAAPTVASKGAQHGQDQVQRTDWNTAAWDEDRDSDTERDSDTDDEERDSDDRYSDRDSGLDSAPDSDFGRDSWRDSAAEFDRSIGARPQVDEQPGEQGEEPTDEQPEEPTHEQPEERTDGRSEEPTQERAYGKIEEPSYEHAGEAAHEQELPTAVTSDVPAYTDSDSDDEEHGPITRPSQHDRVSRDVAFDGSDEPDLPTQGRAWEIPVSGQSSPPPLPVAAVQPPPLPATVQGPPPLPVTTQGPPPLPAAVQGPPPLPASVQGPPPLPAEYLAQAALASPPPLPATSQPISAAPAASFVSAPVSNPPVSHPPIAVTPPGAPNAFDSPESWRPPGPSAPPRRIEDEAGLIAAARAALAEGDDQRALGLAQRCLSRFPQAVTALQLAAGVLARLERWEELANLYEQLIAGHPDAVAVSKLCVAASRLYAAKLGRHDRAIVAIERACELQPKNSELHLEAAGLHETVSQLQFAENHYRTALNVDPLNDRCYRRAAAYFTWTGQQDAAWNAASVLCHLGAPDPNEQALLLAHRREGLPQPSRALGGTDFAVGLSAAPSDPALGQLLTLMADTVRKITLPKPKQQEQLLKQYTQEDPLKSTATLARAFVWTCRLMQIPPPELYLTEGLELPRLLPIARPAWVVGKGVGRGLTASELVFIWARALSRLRPEAHASLYASSIDELGDVVLAAMAATGRPVNAVNGVGVWVKALKKHADANLLNAFGDRLSGFDVSSVKNRVQAFAAQLDIAGNRLGLLACSDPLVAAQTLARFPAGVLSNQDQLTDLFRYAMSQPYAELRRELGIAVS